MVTTFMYSFIYLRYMKLHIVMDRISLFSHPICYNNPCKHHKYDDDDDDDDCAYGYYYFYYYYEYYYCMNVTTTTTTTTNK